MADAAQTDQYAARSFSGFAERHGRTRTPRGAPPLPGYAPGIALRWSGLIGLMIPTALPSGSERTA